jgi:hypothetical protein
MSDDSCSPLTAEALEAALRHQLGGRILGLRVLVQEGRVVLQGRVPTYHAKQLAQHAALRLLRSHALVNEIHVQVGPGAETS